MIKRLFFIISTILAILSAIFLLNIIFNASPEITNLYKPRQETATTEASSTLDDIITSRQETKKPTKPPKENIKKPNEPDNKKIQPKNVLLDVPFTSQAPFAKWDDLRFQDGCEEASALMAMGWIDKKTITAKEAEKEILKIAAYEKKNYNNFTDTSARDTIEIIFKGYFNYNKAYLKEDIKIENIKEELYKGNLILAPMDGQKLNNPYYTAPGPERHMIAIIGYDLEKNEFITNDPGTKRGEKYRYSEKTLFNAIRDYPTGDHLPIKNIKKTIIVVEKNSEAL